VKMANTISDVRQIIASFQDDIDSSNLLQTEGFRVGLLLYIHSGASKKKDYGFTVRKLVEIALINGIQDVNLGALRQIIIKYVKK